MCDCNEREINRIEDMCEDCQAEYIAWYESTQQLPLTPIGEAEFELCGCGEMKRSGRVCQYCGQR